MSLKKILKRFFRRKKRISVPFERLDVTAGESDGTDKEILKIINLLNYSKRSDVSYGGKKYEVGYHSFKMGDHCLKGQRDPSIRFKKVKYDFDNKTVLDIGCNQGGMLFKISDRIKCGVGVDYDSRMINVANKIKSYTQSFNLFFYTFDLENENLEIINDLLGDDTVDICFLLSVCKWLKNWKEVIDYVYRISGNLLFESNGSVSQQEDQIKYLHMKYPSVELLSHLSDDDIGQKKRKLYLCSKAS